MLVLTQVSLRRGVKLVLDRTSLTIQPGEKVGLVGRNGAGKSSLFSLLAGRLQADAGDVALPPRWRIGEVAQEMPETDQGATDFVLAGDTALAEAEAELARAEASDDGHAMAHAHESINLAGGFDARPRAQAMLLGLGFKVGELDAPVSSFSGGWRMRLQLARALMCPADLMLLDEPTNHLDLDALVWLEAWLQRYAGTMIVISHDREFLDAVTKVTVHLDETKLVRYTGNYTAFEEMRAIRITQATQSYEKQKERMAHLQKFIDRFKAKASKAKQAQSRVKALSRMEKLAPVLTSADFQFEFKEPQSLPNPMLAFADVACGYPAEGGSSAKRIVDHIDRSVLAGQRIGILGANGQGKSTFVKTIAGDLAPLSGEIVAGKGLTIGYFAQQELDVLSPGDGPLMHMVRLARDVGPAGREQELRDFLGSFRFTGPMVQQAVGTLSGGEKARLVLAMLVWQRPNLLLLDEPTNHLDLTTREALSMALNEFEGTVMIVSHDRALLRETCDEFWLVTGGMLRPFDGDLDDYQKWLLDVSRAAARGQPAPPVPSSRDAIAAAPTPVAAPVAKSAPMAKPSSTPAAKGDDRKAQKQQRAKQADATRPQRAELQRIETRLARLAVEKADTEAKLAAPTTGMGDFAELGRQLAHVNAETTVLEERWLALQGELA